MADPYLQLGGGGGHPDPEIRGGEGVLQKKKFPPFGPQFGLKIRRGRRPLGPSPGSATEQKSDFSAISVTELDCHISERFLPLIVTARMNGYLDRSGSK